MIKPSTRVNKKCINDPLYTNIKKFLKGLVDKALETGDEKVIKEAKRKYEGLVSKDIMIDNPVMTKKGLLVNFVTRKTGFIRADVLIDKVDLEDILNDFSLEIKEFDDEEQLKLYVNENIKDLDEAFKLIKFIKNDKLAILIGKQDLEVTDVITHFNDIFFDKYTLSEEDLTIESANIDTVKISFYKVENLVIDDPKLIGEILFPSTVKPYVENIIKINLSKDVNVDNLRINNVGINEEIPIENVINNKGNAEWRLDNNESSVWVKFVPIDENTEIKLKVELLNEDGSIGETVDKEESVHVDEEAVINDMSYEKMNYPFNRPVKIGLGIDVDKDTIDDYGYELGCYNSKNESMVSNGYVVPNRSMEGVVNQDYPLTAMFTLDEDKYDPNGKMVVLVKDLGNGEILPNGVNKSNIPTFEDIPLVEWDMEKRIGKQEPYNPANTYTLFSGMSFFTLTPFLERIRLNKEDISIIVNDNPDSNLDKEQITIVDNDKDPTKVDIVCNKDYVLGVTNKIVGTISFIYKNEPYSVMGEEIIDTTLTTTANQFIMKDVEIDDKDNMSFAIYDVTNKKETNIDFDKDIRFTSSTNKECSLTQSNSIVYNKSKRKYVMPISANGFGDYEITIQGIKPYPGTYANPDWVVEFEYLEPEINDYGVLYPMIAKIDGKAVGYLKSSINTPLEESSGTDRVPPFSLNPSHGYNKAKGEYTLNYSNSKPDGESYSFKGSISIGDNKALYPFLNTGTYSIAES